VRTQALIVALVLPAPAADTVEFFERRIRPVLAAKCYSCHSGSVKSPMGGLRLDQPLKDERMRSRVAAAVSYQEAGLRMPPSGKLADPEIADIQDWIRMGAPMPAAAAGTDASLTADREKGIRFWAFQPPRAVEPPAGAGSPVDRFLRAALAAKGLTHAPPAPRRDWIRRVTFDLTGLPPLPEEVDAFLADASGQAYAGVVDRLLASPHYGERWARHWLDLVRFAETNGHEFDNNKLDAWRYRDYVIRAFNEDLPYDQFVREHIAGDLLPVQRATRDGSHFESPLGTSAFWFGEVLNSATDSVKSRADTVDNQIDVFGKTFLGLTLACARCHDHKFDPIPTRDYYALAGIFHSTAMRETVIDTPARRAEIASAARRIAALGLPPPSPPPSSALRQGDEVFADFGRSGFEGWMIAGQAFGERPSNGAARSTGPGTDAMVGSLTSRKFRMPKLWVHILMEGSKPDGKVKEEIPLRVTVVADDHKSAHLVAKEQPGFHWVSARMTKEIGRVCYFEIVDRDRSGHIAVSRILFSDDATPPALETAPAPPSGQVKPPELAALEREFPVSVWGMIAADEDPGNVRVHLRGDHRNLGEEVPRGFLRVFQPETGAGAVAGGSGRLELSRQLTDGRNPLLARVMVNRVWKHHFGHGLVRTADNFGLTGDRPTHPELLDWLARRFMETGWSVKALHREILLTDAYRMSCRADRKAMAADPRNDLLHHMPVRRLEAESIRDSLLAVAGTLDRSLHGPGIPPHISKYQDGRGKPQSGPADGRRRRSVYIQVRRNFLTPLLLAFDYPLPVSTIGTRGSSTAPPQALMMMNNEFVAGQAKSWAARLEAEEPDSERRLEKAYREAFARLPEEWERRETLAFAARRGWAELCHALFNSTEFIYVQ